MSISSQNRFLANKRRSQMFCWKHLHVWFFKSWSSVVKVPLLSAVNPSSSFSGLITTLDLQEGDLILACFGSAGECAVSHVWSGSSDWTPLGPCFLWDDLFVFWGHKSWGAGSDHISFCYQKLNWKYVFFPHNFLLLKQAVKHSWLTDALWKLTGESLKKKKTESCSLWKRSPSAFINSC